MIKIATVKNKWINQRIHKKYNKIQYASKHYISANHQVYDNTDLIFKKKYPVKQRKDRKNLKSTKTKKN